MKIVKRFWTNKGNKGITNPNPHLSYLSHQPTTVKQFICFYRHTKVEQNRCISFPRQSLILGTRYKTVLFRKLADAFLMMYQTAAVEIFTNNRVFGGFCHGNPVSIERVHSGVFGMEKARKRRNIGVYRLLDRWQGQKDLNPRHAVLESMLKFLSRSDFSPILGICCQWQRWCFKNWCFFDDMN